MSVLLPIIFVIVSLGAIAVILYRKIDYIHKLSPEVLSDNKMVDGGFFRAYFVELYDYAQKLNLRSQAISMLSDIAKLLRGFKILFLKIERHTSDLIHAIQAAVQEQEEQIAQARKRSLEASSVDEIKTFNQGAQGEKKGVTDASQNIASATTASNSAQSLNSSQQYVSPVSGAAAHSRVVQASDSNQKNRVEMREDNPYGVVVTALDAEALEDLRRQEQRLILAIAKTPRDPDLYKLLGDIYTQTEEYEDAKESYQRALKFDPDDYIIKTKLAKVLRKLEQIV